MKSSHEKLNDAAMTFLHRKSNLKAICALNCDVLIGIQDNLITLFIAFVINRDMLGVQIPWTTAQECDMLPCLPLFRLQCKSQMKNMAL